MNMAGTPTRRAARACRRIDLAEAGVGGEQEAVQQERDEGVAVPAPGLLGADGRLDDGDGQGEQQDRPGSGAEGGQLLQQLPPVPSQIQQHWQQEQRVDHQEVQELQVRRFEQVRWVIGADEPGELEAQVDLEEVPVELPVGARALPFEAQLGVDLWGDDQQQADQKRDQQPGQPLPDEAGRGAGAERVSGAQTGHHEQQRHPLQAGEQHEQRYWQVGRPVLHVEVQRVEDAGGVEEDQPAHHRRPHKVQVLPARASRGRHGRAHRPSVVKTHRGGPPVRSRHGNGATNVEL
jgi:hypothetical protein